MSQNEEIRALLQAFQEGYTAWEVTQIEAFMQLFMPEAEVIGGRRTED